MISALGYLLIPATTTAVGGLLASWWIPSRRAQASIQHLAAGIILGAATLEVIPSIEQASGQQGWLLVGFAVGCLAMFGLRAWTRSMEVPDGIPLGLIVVSGIDILIDGLTVGAGLSFSGHLGLLLAIGIAVELSLLGLTVGRELAESGHRWRPFVLTALYAGVLLVGGVLGLLLLGRLPELATTEVLAFGAAALLYLVTEELLVEAHETEEPDHNTLILFAGFIAFWGLRWVMPGS